MAATLTPEQESRVKSAYDLGLPVRQASRTVGVGKVAVRNRYRQWQEGAAPEKAPGVPPEASAEGVEEFTEEGDRATVRCIVGSDGVVTEEDLVRVCKIDLTRWRIARMKFKAYQGQMKVAVREADEKGRTRITEEAPRIVQLYSVSADLERVISRAFDAAVTDFFAQFKAGVEPLPPAIHVLRGRRVMAEFDLCDVHFGKLAYHRESGQDYDLKIAERVFANAVDDLIERARGREIEKIVVPFGNDYTHIDNGNNTTTSGTPVDTDGRYSKIYKVALWSFYRAVERWRSIAPTEIKLVRGNHDFDTSMGLIHALALKFDGDASVAIDTEPAIRKWGIYGRTAFGYEHGNDIRPSEVRDLPGLMLKEAPKEWIAEADFHEFHIGHYHSEKKFTTRDTDTGVGFVTRFMHSLSAVDAWHFRKKYVASRRAAEVLFYDRDIGFTGHDLALARD